jgi:hypothetical protein
MHRTHLVVSFLGLSPSRRKTRGVSAVYGRWYLVTDFFFLDLSDLRLIDGFYGYIERVLRLR